MADVSGYDRDYTGSGDLGYAGDGHLELALDHLVDLFLRMAVFVNGRTAHEGFMPAMISEHSLPWRLPCRTRLHVTTLAFTTLD
jgi:hypothetical protein